MARPGGIGACGLPDDFIADQQPVVRSAVAVVGVIRLVGIVGLIRWFLRRRLTQFEPFVRQFGWPAIAVSPAGIQRLER